MEELKDVRLFGKFVEKNSKDFINVVGIITVPFVYLLIQRKVNAIYFPGGVVEEGEKPMDALKRELREEMGAKIIDISSECIETFVYSPKKGKCARVLSFVGKVKLEDNVKLKGDEIMGALIFHYKDINLNLIKRISEFYPVGPSVVDAFVIKREKLHRMIREVLQTR